MRPVSAPDRLHATSRWVPLTGAVAAVLVLYAPVLAGMAVEWVVFPSLSYGLAVPFVSAYLLWRRRDLISGERLDGTNRGLVVLVVAIVIFIAGSLSGETLLSRVSLPLALLGLALFMAGPRITRHAWSAIAYLFFMIPAPYLTVRAATHHARLFEAAVTAKVLRWLSVPVLQDGVMLHLEGVTLEVADDCSGVRVVAPLLALGAAYALIQPRSTWMRVALILMAAPLGLLANLLRLVVTALGVHGLGPFTLNSIAHQFSGTTVLLAAVILLVGLDRLLIRGARPASR